MIAVTIAGDWHLRRLIMRKADARGGLGCAMRRIIMGLLGLLAAAPVMAEDRAEMITASNPPGIVIAMLNAGHDPELTTDRTAASSLPPGRVFCLAAPIMAGPRRLRVRPGNRYYPFR